MIGSNMRNRIALIALAGIAAMGIVASACGDDDDDAEDGDANPTAAVTPNAANPTAEPTEDPSSIEPAAIIVAKDAGELGTILTTIDGYTLYTFANDVAGDGKSACEGGCAAAWPPLPVVSDPTGGDGVTGELDTITRPDGLTQVTYNGLPLYMFANDNAPGDTNGKDVPNWSIATP